MSRNATAGRGEELVFVSEMTRVSRRRLPDGTALICKKLLGDNALQRLRHERRILERLAGVEGVPQLAEGPAPANTIVMLDEDALPWRGLADAEALPPRHLLPFASAVAGILAAVHQQGVVHKNITPHNLLVTPAFEPLLIDFSLATTFAEERPGFLHHREIAGTLGYLAPEQTGRTGRGVDQRTDLYALGATLYQLATGRPPFDEQDPLQLIHDILARVPVPPGWLTPSLPQGMSDIIMRLLEKEPDRRYQSAQGVLHDLGRVAAACATGRNGVFRLGEGDFPQRLAAPSRLVGRERELAALREAFEGAVAGRGSCLLVAGAAGVGKSALVNELRPLVSASRGFFVCGKFDQYRRDLASDAVHQAFRALGSLLLAEPEQELSALREKLVQLLGPNAGLVAGLVPEMALLLAVPPRQAAELHSKERLIQAALDQLRAVASPQRPLVVVLDDLQWGAPTPLGTFDALLTSQPIPGLLLVGCFRDREVEPSHPFRVMMSRWDALGISPPLLRLDNLRQDELTLFVQEMLRLNGEQAARLAESLAARTGGNPYDTVELVNALRRDGTLSAGQQGWSWAEGAIDRYLGHGEVVELLDVRMRRLPRQTQSVLETMACLGSCVFPPLLSLSAGLTPDQLEEALAPALEDGVILPGEQGRLRFRHDRVQQAAYDRLDPEQRIALHLGVARRVAPLPEHQTLAAEQYLQALCALEDPAELKGVLAIFRGAAAGMVSVNAQQAERFLLAALRLLERLGGGEDPSLRLGLETELHAALYILGRLEDGDEAYRRIEELSTAPLERAAAATVQLCSLTNRAKSAKAVALGLELLGELGYPIPQGEELAAETALELAAFYAWLESGLGGGDFQRPELTEPVALAAARLMNRVIPAAFFSDQAMISWWLVTKSRRLWAEHGPCRALAGPLGHLAFVTISLEGEFRKGGEGVRHVQAVSEARGWEPESSQLRFLYSMTVGPWHRPLQDNVVEALRAEEGLLQGGDPLNACLTYYATIPQLLDCSANLEAFAAETERAVAFATRTGNAHILASLHPYRELTHALRAEAPPESPPHHRTGIALGISHLTRGLLAALMGEAGELARHAAGVEDSLHYLQGNYPMAQAALLRTFAAARQLKDSPGEPSLLARLNRCRLFLSGRAAESPENFLHLLRWMDAERAWGMGELQGAVSLFDQALQQLEGIQRPWQRALICERAARCQMESGLGHQGGLLMREASRLYREWGALAKVRQLEGEYPFLRPTRRAGHQTDQLPSVSADTIDLMAVLRASQALSSETSLERLTAVVVELLRTMTGATAVALLVKREESASWHLLDPGHCDGLKLPLEEAAREGLIPLSLFHYARRTGEAVVVKDALLDDRFSHDRYFTRYACCSALALPILTQGSPRAILLLENRLSRGAFTADLLDAVTLIAGQLAVSVENALLYQRLEERVRERTRELQEAQQELICAARHAGRAEIASNVLHNVGNVLTSVNTSAEIMTSRLKGARIWGVARAAELLKSRRDDLQDFLGQDKQGRLLPEYLEKVSQTLHSEQQELLSELSRLTASVNHIKVIVATQQCYAGSGSLIEPVSVPELVEDALRINLGSLTRHQVSVVREFGELPVLSLDKGRLLQVLVNLLSNARQAMESTAEPQLIVRAAMAGAELLRITVSDRGEGIPPENLSRIFSHGFTTRKNGHGFGLHSCALAAREMGGTLMARSEGSGRGATFVLEIPVKGNGGGDGRG